MKVIVTGGAGFIGSHLVDRLLDDDHSVIVIDNLVTGSINNIAHNEHNSLFSFIKVDICDQKSIGHFFEGIDWVFHLAGRADIVPSIENPRAYFDTNVTGTLNVLECVRNSSVKRFIYAASSSCYGIPDIYPTPESAPIVPQYPYALTKYMGEKLVLHWAHVYKLPALSLRLFNVFGPRSRTTGVYGAVFGVFLAQKMKNKPFTVVGDGEQTRDFTYVTDVVDAFITAVKSDYTRVAMNIGSGNHYSINKLIQLLGGEVLYVPKRPGEPDCTYADILKAREMLGWSPKVSFEEGVEIMLSHMHEWGDAPVWEAESIARVTKSWFRYLS